jgi:hypothetical protein
VSPTSRSSTGPARREGRRAGGRVIAGLAVEDLEDPRAGGGRALGGAEHVAERRIGEISISR